MEHDITESHLLLDAWGWVERNRKPVIIGVVAVALAGLLATSLAWSRKQKQMDAGEALSQVLLNQMLSGGQTQAAEALLKVANANPGTPGGAQAQLLAAGDLFVSGKYQEAQGIFERFSRDYVGHALLPQAKLGLAACLAAQGKSEEAARAYKDLADRYPSANTAPQARFALAGIYESQGKLEDAMGLLEQVARAEMNGALGSEAGMRAEEIRLKLPPVPAAPTPLSIPAAPTNHPPAAK